MTVLQVNWSMIHTLWSIERCSKAGVNMYCKLLQGSKLSSDKKNSLVLETASVEILLDQ